MARTQRIHPSPYRFSLLMLALGTAGCCKPAGPGSTIHEGPVHDTATEAEQPAAVHAAPAAAPGPTAAPASAAVATVPAQFVVTEDADEWVRQSFQVQERYDRLILVDAGKRPATGARIPPLDLHTPSARAAPPASGPVREAELVVDTLQEAVDASRGGDLIAVMPGTYGGFTMDKRPGVGPGKYIRMVALGAPGAVKITGASAHEMNAMASFRTAQYVIFEGFHIAGTSRPGAPAPDTPKAGILLDGNFGESGEMAHHIALIRVLSHHHNKWGMHSTDTHTVLMQDSLYGFSGKEHAAYVSDGSDDYVIRRNVFIGSNASGLQCNMDSHASFEELIKHPDMRHLAPIEPTRAWVLRALRAATERFGEGNFPDGRGVNFIIEENVINGNGQAGASAFNFASLSRSLIQNNLLYGNLSSGIAQWDDANDFDEPFRSPGPADADQFQGPDDLPMFGCQNNVVRHNTVMMSRAGRPALQARNGSWGMRAYGNILINDAGPSIEIWNTSLYQLDSGYNVVNRIAYEGSAEGMRPLARTLPEDGHTTAGYTQERIAAELVRPGDAPWAVLDGDWWQLAPARPDFRPRPGSALLAGSARSEHAPPRDLRGAERTAGSAAIGALEP